MRGCCKSCCRGAGRWFGAYLGLSALILVGVGSQVGTEIFPRVDTGQFQLRLKAATGTRIELTDEIAKQGAEDRRRRGRPAERGLDRRLRRHDHAELRHQQRLRLDQWPEEAVLRIALKPDSGIRLDELRPRLAKGAAGKAGGVADGAVAEGRPDRRGDRGPRGRAATVL